jgi:hypothetical protein
VSSQLLPDVTLTSVLIIIIQAESLLCGVLFLVALIYQHSLAEEGKALPTAGRSAANSLAVLIYLMAATVSAMLLFGVVQSRPSYLMPFFWIRLCDFFFSLPAFLSSLYANPAYASHWEQSHATPSPGFIDVKRVWPPGSAGSNSLLVSTCVILFKGYFLCVVWKCYRYLKMREMILPLQLSFPASVGTDICLPPGFMPPPVTVTMSPPDYETATKGSSAPPDYETAIRQQDLKAPESPTPTATTMAQSSSSSNSDAESSATPEHQAVAAAASATVIQVHVEDDAVSPVTDRESGSQRVEHQQATGDERPKQNVDVERGEK